MDETNEIISSPNSSVISDKDEFDISGLVDKMRLKNERQNLGFFFLFLITH